MAATSISILVFLLLFRDKRSQQCSRLSACFSDCCHKPHTCTPPGVLANNGRALSLQHLKVRGQAHEGFCERSGWEKHRAEAFRLNALENLSHTSQTIMRNQPQIEHQQSPNKAQKTSRISAQKVQLLFWVLSDGVKSCFDQKNPKYCKVLPKISLGSFKSSITRSNMVSRISEVHVWVLAQRLEIVTVSGLVQRSLYIENCD